MGSIEEQDILRKFRTEPELAFKLLMNSYSQQVVLFCRRAARSQMDAEDLAQEVFIRVWKGLSRFRGDSSLTTWIYRIAWNVCASHLDKQGRAFLTTSYTEQDSEDERAFVPETAVQDERRDGFENRQFIKTLFAGLPASHRLLLTLYYLQEQSYDEISTITGMPMGTVKATLHRAKAGMRKAALKEMELMAS